MGAKKKAATTTDENGTGLILGNRGKCAIVVVILASLLANKLVYNGFPSFNFGGSSVKTWPYINDDEPFLELVNKTYADKDLHLWEPAAPLPSVPDAPGDLGKAVVVPPEKEEEAEKRFSEHEFNVVASEMMSYNRTLADSRYDECRAIEYPNKLPQTSVIIVFHNEAWSTLIRTLWSVHTHSPRALLKEIILVDDFSDFDFLIQKLHDYIKTFPTKVVMLRTLKRTGLIQARLLGSKFAKAPVLTFLDAHCECNQGWLEPLLARVAEDRSVAIAPVIDVISEKDFSLHTAVTDIYGSFSLGLTFKWSAIPERETDRITNDRTALVRSPAMAGGLFAIDKEYFYKIGSYDEGMKIWGGENIEMSVRLWSCGGSVEMAPCSRVGHVFRKKTPYTLPGGAAHVVFFNVARFVDAWLDEYKEYYYSMNPGARPKKSNVTERINLRKNLKCKSFRWYIDNIYPESVYSVEHYHLGQLENVGAVNRCIDHEGRPVREEIDTNPCHNLGGNQLFMLTEKDEIRADEYCLDASAIDKPVTLWPCHNEKGNQEWLYNEAARTLQHAASSNCLAVDPENQESLLLQPCDGSPHQQWKLTTPKILTE